jgi:hypothetical protein
MIREVLKDGKYEYYYYHASWWNQCLKS